MHNNALPRMFLQGVEFVFGMYSVGSLKASLGVGTLLMADDFYCPADLRRIYTDARAHFMPGFDEKLRESMIAILRDAGMHPVTHGTYVNSAGPRFETKAEIRIMAQAGEVVGMTGAHESVACSELHIPYAMLCMVDNFANGIGPILTLEAFHEAQAANMATVEKCVAALVAQLPLAAEAFTRRGHGSHSVAPPPAATTTTVAASPLSSPVIASGAGAVPASEDGATPLPTPVPSSPKGPIHVDTLIHARYVVPVASGREQQVLDHHSVAILDGVIVDVLPTRYAATRYAATRVITMDSRHALIPGLINAHTHLPLNLLRGVADDMPLAQWLTEQIWPTEARLVSPDFCEAGAVGAVAELIRSGVTTINDMYWFPDSTASVIHASGMRATLGMTIIEFPSAYASGAADYIEKGLALKAKWDAAQPTTTRRRIRWSIAPHAPYTVSDATFTRVKEVADAHSIKVHVHLHETCGEVECSTTGTPGMAKHMSETLQSPIDNLDRMGLLSPSLIAVHMTQLTDGDIARLAATKSSVVHCPNSNLKLASGFCPVAKLLTAGVNVALGTDSASSNNSLDFFQEMKLAAVLAKGVASDATALPAWQALRMATLNGAIALGIDDHTGSIEVGKQADLVAVDLGGLDQLPVYNVISHLVYATNRSCVTDVWVDGQALLTGRVLVTVDEGHVRRTMMKWAEEVRPGMTALDKHEHLPAAATKHMHTSEHGEGEAGKVHTAKQ